MGRERVVVAMSGGVDSSVAAALLLRQGYEVFGVTLLLLPCEDRPLGGACCSVESVAQARAVADRLGIEHLVADARAYFEERVLRRCWEAYAAGLTPNPCALCNQDLKWGVLYERARALGAARIATGHYARIGAGPSGRPSLMRGLDPQKDQAYFLFCLSEPQLAATLLPLGGLAKPEVRALARELGLSTAERPESQDACFGTSEDGFAESLRLRFGAEPRPGRIVDPAGKELGRHEGLHRFTLGQRRGLGVALGGRAFVVALRPEANEVVVSRDDTPLWSRTMLVQLAGAHDRPLPARCGAQIRSRHRAVPARLEPVGEDRALAVFEEPQRAVTPGQAAVFFDGDRVVGGGWILEASG